MNRQLDAMSDAELAAFDGGEDMTPDVPTPEQYSAALHRLRNTRRATIGDSSGLPEIEVEVYFDKVTIRDEYSYVVLSTAMLRQAADWVEAQQ